jgi:hypothetical protein
MTAIPFKYYMHASSDGEQLEDALLESVAAISPDPDFDQGVYVADLIEKMGRPFYEVTLNCEVDSETGNVTILSATA